MREPSSGTEETGCISPDTMRLSIGHKDRALKSAHTARGRQRRSFFHLATSGIMGAPPRSAGVKEGAVSTQDLASAPISKNTLEWIYRLSRSRKRSATVGPGAQPQGLARLRHRHGEAAGGARPHPPRKIPWHHAYGRRAGRSRWRPSAGTACWSGLLVDVLGLPWHLVDEEAGRLEHHITPEVEERLMQFLGIRRPARTASRSTGSSRN